MSTAGVDPAVVALLERARSGDPGGVAAFYTHYADVVHGYVRRRVGAAGVAEDLTADVFVRALRALPGFTWADRDPRAWLLTIARNRVHDHHRAASTHREEPWAAPPEGDDDARDPADVAVSGEVADALQDALARLTPDHREVLELRFVQDLTVAEAATVLARSPEAVRALQYRALRALATEVSQVPALAELASVGLQGLVVALLALRPAGAPARRHRGPARDSTVRSAHDGRPHGRWRVTPGPPLRWTARPTGRDR